MKIASIYNSDVDAHISVLWNEETKEITYRDMETGEEWSSDESAETLQEAIDDTYSRYCYGWDLEFEESDTIDNPPRGEKPGRKEAK